MHSVTIKYFKTLELIHFQITTPKRGKPKPRRGKPKPRRGKCSPTERNLISDQYQLVYLSLLVKDITVNSTMIHPNRILYYSVPYMVKHSRGNFHSIHGSSHNHNLYQ